MVCESSWRYPTSNGKTGIHLPLQFQQGHDLSCTGGKKGWLSVEVPVTSVCPFFVEVRAGTPLSICHDIGGGSLPLPQIVCRKISVFQSIIVINHTVSWIYSRTRTKEIPFYKIGKYVRFDPEEVVQWFRDKTMAQED